jgi:hypothetical protein
MNIIEAIFRKVEYHTKPTDKFIIRAGEPRYPIWLCQGYWYKLYWNDFIYWLKRVNPILVLWQRLRAARTKKRVTLEFNDFFVGMAIGINSIGMIREGFNLKSIYIAAPRLGIPSQIRLTYKFDPGMAELWYLNKIYKEKLDEAFQFESNEERVLLLCVENLKDPNTPYCHRIWLRNYLVSQGWAELGEVVE